MNPVACDRMVPVSLVARLSALLAPAGHASLVPHVLARVDPHADVPTTVDVLVALLSPRHAEALTGPVIALFDTCRDTVDPAPEGLSLSVRETQVLIGIRQGMSSASIGRELHLSEHTVKTHIARLFRTLGVRNRAGAVAMAYEAGLLPADRQVA